MRGVGWIALIGSAVLTLIAGCGERRTPAPPPVVAPAIVRHFASMYLNAKPKGARSEKRADAATRSR